jgi:hypothetical protein
MGLWGATDADESQPKYLTDAEKLKVFANTHGWVMEAGATESGNDNTAADPEVLVAIGDLSESAKLNTADIVTIDWNSTTADKSDGFTLGVTVRFNEAVEVNTTGGIPYVRITNSNAGSGSGRGPHDLAYASGTGTHELVFELAIAAANSATNANDVLSVGTNAMALNSGLISSISTEHVLLESGTTDSADNDAEFLQEETMGDYLNQELNTAAVITSVSGIGSAAGTVTVTA